MTLTSVGSPYMHIPPPHTHVHTIKKKKNFVKTIRTCSHGHLSEFFILIGPSRYLFYHQSHTVEGLSRASLSLEQFYIVLLFKFDFLHTPCQFTHPGFLKNEFSGVISTIVADMWLHTIIQCGVPDGRFFIVCVCLLQPGWNDSVLSIVCTWRQGWFLFPLPLLGSAVPWPLRMATTTTRLSPNPRERGLSRSRLNTVLAVDFSWAFYQLEVFHLILVWWEFLSETNVRLCQLLFLCRLKLYPISS